MLFHVSSYKSVRPILVIRSSSKNLFFTRLLPDLVFCVYAFALNGSILGEVLPHKILELALGAIANKCAFRTEAVSSSGHAPLSIANSLVVLSAFDFI